MSEGHYTIVLLARDRVDKRSICRAVNRIEGCTATSMPRMDADELREIVRFEWDERPRATKRKLKAFAGETDVEALSAKDLRAFLWAIRGEQVVAVDVPLESPGAAQQLYDYAKQSGLVAWDELTGAPLKRPKAIKAPPVRIRADYAAAAASMNERGFVRWLSFDDDGFWAGEVHYPPEKMMEVEAHRFAEKGGHGSVLRALLAPNGWQGVIRQFYGNHADPALDALLRRVPGAKHWR